MSQAELMEMINMGAMPPRAGGYGGIDMFATSSANPDHVMNDVMSAVTDMVDSQNGRILLHEPFRIMWSVHIENGTNGNNGNDTIFNLWIRSHSMQTLLIHMDFVAGNARSYVISILPFIKTLLDNGTIVTQLPFYEEEWRYNALERIAEQLRLQMDNLSIM